MKEKEITLNNIKITRFYDNPKFDDYTSEKQDFIIKSIKYHESWDWLMPVVEYIESLDLKESGYTWKEDGVTRYNFEGFSVDMENTKCMIYAHLALDPIDVYNEKTYKIDYPTKLEAVYNAILNFIDTYNEVIKLKN